MSRPKGGIGRGLGALGLGTGVRPAEPNQAETEDVQEAVAVDLKPNGSSNGTLTSVSPASREIANREREGRKTGLTQVPISSIAPNPYQPRKHIDPEVLEELASSIREHGLIQPPVVSYNPDYDENATGEPDEEAATDEPKKERKARYLLIAGERRWQAAKLAGLTSIPVVIKETTPLQMLELALVENIQRADLNPLEEAFAYRQLVNEFGLTQENVAKRVGKSRVSVTNALRLLSLPKTIYEAINEGEITEGHARAILMLDRLPESRRGQAQLRLLREILEQKISVRQAEESARRILRQNSIAEIDAELQTLPPVEEPPKSKPVAEHETHELEARLREALGSKVEISRSKKGGKIVIQYFSDEELEEIFRRIVDLESI